MEPGCLKTLVVFICLNPNSINLNNPKKQTNLFKSSAIVRTKRFKYVEYLAKIMNKRVEFPKEKQKKFLTESRSELRLTWPELAIKVESKRQTLEKAYRFEYCTLPYPVFNKICKLRNIPEKTLLKKYKGKIVKNIPIIGRKVLGENRTNLPNINIKFKNKIPKFDVSKIKLSKYDQKRNIKFPNKLTPELSEEIGMHLGDGFLSERKNEYRLKGDKKEKEYYDKFIRNLYKKLFNLDLNIKEYETTYGFELCSKDYGNFKIKS